MYIKIVEIIKNNNSEVSLRNNFELPGGGGYNVLH